MSNTNENAMSAHELRDIMARQLRTLDQLDVSDRNARTRIDKAKQIFNGAGKMIALSTYVLEAQRVGSSGDILTMPETRKIDTVDLNKKLADTNQSQ